MKRGLIPTLIFLCAISSLITSCQGDQTPIKKFEVLQEEETFSSDDQLNHATVTVSGINCRTCEAKLEGQLKRNPHIQKVAFRQNKFIDLTYEASRVTLEDIKTLIESIQ